MVQILGPINSLKRIAERSRLGAQFTPWHAEGSTQRYYNQNLPCGLRFRGPVVQPQTAAGLDSFWCEPTEEPVQSGWETLLTDPQLPPQFHLVNGMHILATQPRSMLAARASHIRPGLGGQARQPGSMRTGRTSKGVLCFRQRW